MMYDMASSVSVHSVGKGQQVFVSLQKERKKLKSILLGSVSHQNMCVPDMIELLLRSLRCITHLYSDTWKAP